MGQGGKARQVLANVRSSEVADLSTLCIPYRGAQPAAGDNSTENYIWLCKQFIFRTDILPSTKYSQSLRFKQGFLFCETSIKLLALYYQVTLPLPTPSHPSHEPYSCSSPFPQPPTFLSLPPWFLLLTFFSFLFLSYVFFVFFTISLMTPVLNRESLRNILPQ